MEFDEYIKLAMRTNIDGKSFKDNILNGLLGLYGETVEYLVADPNNEMEELGDCYWYLALLCDTMDFIPLGNVAYDKPLLVLIGILCDHFKKHFYQGHALDNTLVETCISSIKINLDTYTKLVLNVEPEEIMVQNIEKLKKRFPDGFDVEKSVNREV